VVQLLLGNAIPLDSFGRPTGLYGRSVHSDCPRRETDEASTYAVDGRCMEEVGCRGPDTKAPCVQSLWNGRQNWCIDANAPCLGCTQPGFPGTTEFYKKGD